VSTHPDQSNFFLKGWLAQFSAPFPSSSGEANAFDAVSKAFDIKLDAGRMLALQNDYLREFAALQHDMLMQRPPPVVDRRLSTAEWNANPLSIFHAAAYQLNARFLNAIAEAVDAPEKIRQRIQFSVQQLVDAMSPANFLATNPEAQRKIIDTKGQSLTQGMMQMLADLQKGHISLTDESAFEVGRDVAATEGSVVFENALFQLIQYKPLTTKVFETPLLIVPPCINKFYILDLQPHNSLVRYALEQGHQVFLVSWCNADASVQEATWNDYVEQVAVAAIHAVQEISKRKQINALGFCVGGTILSCALAALYARGEKPVASITLLTSFLDFSDTGAIDVYIDEMQVALRESLIGKGGLMAGRDFAAAFSSLRPNDLMWNYVESNYLKGMAPTALDLLYWNADSTNLPGPMFCYYLRRMYLENALKDPGRLDLSGTPIDLRRIDAPTFIFASRDDHIVPWKTAYASTTLLNLGKPELNRFVLGAAGHIAGVINAPSKNKRSYWTHPAQGVDADGWLQGATEHPGSWWPEWIAFLAQHAGKRIAPPRAAGAVKYPVIEPAPGRYVLVKAG
jgi:polyhydroxyalkanoate synthase